MVNLIFERRAMGKRVGGRSPTRRADTLKEQTKSEKHGAASVLLNPRLFVLH